MAVKFIFGHTVPYLLQCYPHFTARAGYFGITNLLTHSLPAV